MTWLRSNLAALLVVIALLAATLGVHWWREWSYDVYAQPWRPVDATAAVTEFAGATWEQPKAVLFDAAESADLRAPVNTRVIAAGVRVTAPAGGLSCDLQLRETGGLGRVWSSNAGQIDWPPEIPLGCDRNRTDPYSAGAGFVVPLDASGPFQLEVIVPGAMPQFLRFLVEV